LTAQQSDVEATAAESHRCAQFLYREASLLDRHRLQEWLSLYSRDAIYWVPLLEKYGDRDNELNIVLDDYAKIVDRVTRLESGLAFAQDPPSQTTRLLSNIRVARNATGFQTEAAFVLYEFRSGATQLLAGRYLHDLHDNDGVLSIAAKTIELTNRTDFLFNLTFIL
jgi:3-phenylpropionate/cinnamic acid dioxygenase small subunit